MYESRNPVTNTKSGHVYGSEEHCFNDYTICTLAHVQSLQYLQKVFLCLWNFSCAIQAYITVLKSKTACPTSVSKTVLYFPSLTCAPRKFPCRNGSLSLTGKHFMAQLSVVHPHVPHTEANIGRKLSGRWLVCSVPKSARM